MFYNNVFISRDEPISGDCSKSLFSHNAWWRLDNKQVMNKPDKNGFYGNPGIVMPGPDNYRITDPALLKTLEVFKMVENSPCKGKGIDIVKNGGLNFWGKPVSHVPNIGAE